MSISGGKILLTSTVFLVAAAFGILAWLHAHPPQPEAKDTSLVEIDLKAIGLPGQNATFAPVTSVQSLPAGIRTQLGAMAEPGAKFEATDVISSERLPRKRLVFAGLSQKYCIVHYEIGGLGLSSVVAVFAIADGDAKILWVSDTRLKTLKELKTALESGKLTNELGQTVW